MKTIAFVNNKGGVGKTTLCYAALEYFWAAGLPVRAQDTDTQSSLTEILESLEEGGRPLPRFERPVLRLWDSRGTAGGADGLDDVDLIVVPLQLSQLAINSTSRMLVAMTDSERSRVILAPTLVRYLPDRQLIREQRAGMEMMIRVARDMGLVGVLPAISDRPLAQSYTQGWDTNLFDIAKGHERFNKSLRNFQIELISIFQIFADLLRIDVPEHLRLKEGVAA